MTGRHNIPIRLIFALLLLLSSGLSHRAWSESENMVNKDENLPAAHAVSIMNRGKAEHKMTLDDEGMVMNWNDNQLPIDCEAIEDEHQFTVHAGIKYAEPYPGTVFGMKPHEYHVKPCSRITVTFINDDQIRHQWMVHGLPKYLYDQGMFHLEAAGGATKSGTFIVPSDDKTYLVHCDLAQHMEKGMKAQLVVASGSGNLSSIPGVSGPFESQHFTRWKDRLEILLISMAGSFIAFGLLWRYLD